MSQRREKKLRGLEKRFDEMSVGFDNINKSFVKLHNNVENLEWHMKRYKSKKGIFSVFIDWLKGIFKI